MDRLNTVGELAPKAPLSFVAARIVDAEEMTTTEVAALQKAVANRLRELTRATDMVGRVEENAFGIVLQGTGATAAGAVASRLSFHLNRLAELPRTAAVVVSAATGTGANAETLAVAALDSFEACAG
jgi:GGDEF domain-containing protein